MKNLLLTLPLKLRFLLVGGINTAVSYIMFVLFLYLLGKEHYQVSLASSWFFSSFISFSLQKIVVFQSKGRWLGEYLRCLLSWSIAYVINASLLEVTVTLLTLSPIVGQIISVCSTTVLTYFLFKYFAFKKENLNG